MFEKLAEMFKSIFDTEEIENNVYSYYGVSKKDMNTMVADIVHAFIVEGNKTKAIDKMFPKLSATDRCRVWQFHVAASFIEKVEKHDEEN